MFSEVVQYDALTDEEIILERNILSPGIYPFTVTNARAQKSKSSGNPMLVLTLKVWGEGNQEYTITDYLPLTRKMVWRIKHFWEAVGYPDKYTGQNSTADFINKNGYVRTKTEKDEKGHEHARIEDYVREDTTQHVSYEAKEETHFKDDDLPFL